MNIEIEEYLDYLVHHQPKLTGLTAEENYLIWKSRYLLLARAAQNTWQAIGMDYEGANGGPLVPEERVQAVADADQLEAYGQDLTIVTWFRKLPYDVQDTLLRLALIPGYRVVYVKPVKK